MIESRAKAPVWGVALAAIALFVVVALVAGMFGPAEVATVAAAN